MAKLKVMTAEEKARCIEIDLPDLIAYQIEDDISETRYNVIPKKYYPYTAVQPSCPYPGCGSTDVSLKEYKYRNVLDSARYFKQSRLIIKVPRYTCNKCKNTFTTPLESVDVNQRMTKRLREFIRREAYELIPFSDIARRIGMDESNVVRLCDSILQDDFANYTIDFPEVIGVDEDHFRTYENDYSFIITDPVNMKILDLWPSRETKYLRKHFAALKGSEKVRGITMDMSKDYRRVCEEMFPEARIVCDRFHVIKLITNALDDIRGAVLAKHKAQNKNHPKLQKEVSEDFDVLRDLMLLNQESLSEKAKSKLGSLLTKYPEMATPYIMKEEFRDIYRLSANRKEAIERYEAWTKSYDHNDPLYEPYDILRRRTFQNWRMEFFNYFDFKEEGMPISNGPTEGLNSVVKSIMRTGRGYPIFTVLRAKCVLGAGVREERVITQKMQMIKKQMMRQGVTDEALYENEMLRQAAIEAEQERKNQRRKTTAKRKTVSKLEKSGLLDGDDEPPAPPIRRFVQAEFDFSELDE